MDQDDQSQQSIIHSPRRSHQYIVTIAWIACFLLTSGGFLFHVVSQVSQFVEVPRNMRLKFLEKFRVPQITLCRKQPYTDLQFTNTQFIQNRTFLQPDLAPLNISFPSLSQRFIFFLTTVLNHTLSKVSERTVMQMMKDWTAATGLHPTLFETIFYCNSVNRTCSYKNFTIMKHPKYISCIQFTPSVANISYDTGRTLAVLMVPNWQGPSRSVTLGNTTANVMQFESADWVRGGFVYSFDPPGYRPRLSLGPMTITQSSVLYIEYKNVTVKPTKSNPCNENAPSNITYVVDALSGETNTFFMTTEDCLIQWKQRRLFQSCGCVSLFDYVPVEFKGAPFCHSVPPFLLFFDYVNLSKASGRWQMYYGNVSYDYVDESVKANLITRATCFQTVTSGLNAEDSGCLKFCQTAAYTVSIISGPPLNINQSLQNNSLSNRYQEFLATGRKDGVMKYYNEIATSNQLIWITFQFNSRLPPFILAEDFTYIWTNFLADLGGIAGLWFGACLLLIITVFERVRGKSIFSKRGLEKVFLSCSQLLREYWVTEVNDRRHNWCWNVNKLTFAGLIFLMIAAAVTHLTFQTLAYVSQSLAMHQEPNRKPTAFPDVTFCSFTPWNLQLVFSNLPLVDNTNPGRNISFDAYIERVRQFSWNVLNNSEGRYTLQQLLRRKSKLISNFTSSIAEEVIYCRFNGNPCSYKDFQEVKHLVHLQCFVFIPSINANNPASSTSSLEVAFANYNRIYYHHLGNQSMNNWSIAVQHHGYRPNIDYYHFDATTTTTGKQIEVSYRSFHQLPETSKCLHDLDNVTYIVDWTTNETQTFRATQLDCENNFAQNVLFKKCGCVDGFRHVPLTLSQAPFCVDIHDFLLNYDSLQQVNGSWRMKYGNQTYDYLEEAAKLGLLNRERCFRQVVDENFTSDLKDGNVSQPCRVTCTNSQYFLTSDLDFSLQPAELDQLRSLVSTEMMAKLGPVNPSVFSVRLVSNVNGEELVEVWPYTFASYLANVGGVIGFWLDVNVYLVLHATVALLLFCFGIKNVWNGASKEDEEETNNEDLTDKDSPVKKMLSILISNFNWIRILLALAIVGGMAVHITYHVISYFKENKPLTLLVKENDTSNDDFPTITFCNPPLMTPGRNMVTLTEERIIRGAPPLVISVNAYLQRLNKYYSDFARSNYLTDVRPLAMMARKLAFDENFFNFSLTPKKYVFYCRFRGEECSYNNFTVVPHPKFFLCFQFVPPKVSNASEAVDVVRNESRMQITEPNMLEVGLVIPAVPENIYSPAIYDSFISVMMKLHVFDDSSTLSLWYPTGKVVSAFHNIGYRVVNSFSTSKSPCRAEDAPLVTYFTDWTHKTNITLPRAERDDCVNNNIQEYLLKTCGCVDISLFVPIGMRDAPLCHDVPPFLLNYDTLVFRPNYYNPSLWFMNYSGNLYHYNTDDGWWRNAPYVAKINCHSALKQALWNVSTSNCSTPCRRVEFRWNRPNGKYSRPVSDKQKMILKMKEIEMQKDPSNPTFTNASVLFFTFKMESEGQNIRKYQLAYPLLPLTRFVVDLIDITVLWIGLCCIVLVQVLKEVVIWLKTQYLLSTERTMEYSTRDVQKNLETSIFEMDTHF